MACLAIGVDLPRCTARVRADRGLARLDGDLFGNQASQLRPATAGAQAAILGTLWLMVGTALIALPIGMLAAVYLEEYADGRGGTTG